MHAPHHCGGIPLITTVAGPPSPRRHAQHHCGGMPLTTTAAGPSSPVRQPLPSPCGGYAMWQPQSSGIPLVVGEWGGCATWISLCPGSPLAGGKRGGCATCQPPGSCWEGQHPCHLDRVQRSHHPQPLPLLQGKHHLMYSTCGHGEPWTLNPALPPPHPENS